MSRLGLILMVSALISMLSPQVSGITLTNCTEAELRAAFSNGGLITIVGESTVVVTNSLIVASNSVLDATSGKLTLTGLGAPTLLVQPNARFTINSVVISDSEGTSAAFINSGTSVVSACRFERNQNMFGPGGGAIHNRGRLTVVNSTFAQNRADAGAAILSSDGGNLDVSGSLFHANWGTAITVGDLFAAGPTTFTNCTFVRNQFAVSTAPTTSPNGRVTLVNCTVAHNGQGVIASSFSPGFYSEIFLLNTALSGNTNANVVGPIIDAGNNASSDASAGFVHPASRTNLNLLLGALTNNGGPTLSMLPLPGSPLIDAGNTSGAPTVDQRGIGRPFGIASDVGATEFGLGGGEVGFEHAVLTVRESDTTATLVIVRADDGSGPGSVQVQTIAGTADADIDFWSTNIVLNFAAGETWKEFEVILRDDAIFEPIEQFSVVLTNATGEVKISEAAQVVTVRLADDESVELPATDFEALAAAVTNGQSVRFVTGGVLVFSNELFLNGNVLIDANGQNVTLSGSNATRLFQLSPGATLHLKGMRIADGFALGAAGTTNFLGAEHGGPGEGGAVRNFGKLIAENCVFTNNSARGGVGAAGRLIMPQPQGGGPGVGGPAFGGAIHNEGGAALLTNCVFEGNSSIGGVGGIANPLSAPAYGGEGGASSGGAIASRGGTVHTIGCVFRGNSSLFGQPGQGNGRTASSRLAAGGALYVHGGSANSRQTVFTSNLAGGTGVASPAHGGAILATNATFTLLECSLEGNTVQGGRAVQNSFLPGPAGDAIGGAIASSAGFVAISNSSIVRNQVVGGVGLAAGGKAAIAKGGGVHSAGTLAAVNCTFSENGAAAGLGSFFSGSAFGGGLYIGSGVASFFHATIASNRVAMTRGSSDGSRIETGSAIYVENGASATVENTILAHSDGKTNCFGSIIDGGGNVSTDASASFSQLSSFNSTDPGLAPLDHYDGPGWTMALLEGSAAIDAAINTGSVSFDQRGRVRPFGTASDIGAFESSPPWSVRGRIVGYHRPQAVSVNLGTNSTTTALDGSYHFLGLLAGNVTVIPSEAEFVMVPHMLSANLTRDTIGVNFDAFLRNALTPEKGSNGTFRALFAGNIGETVVLERAVNLPEWEPVATNVIEQSGVSVLAVPQNSRREFYRAKKQ